MHVEAGVLSNAKRHATPSRRGAEGRAIAPHGAHSPGMAAQADRSALPMNQTNVRIGPEVETGLSALATDLLNATARAPVGPRNGERVPVPGTPADGVTPLDMATYGGPTMAEDHDMGLGDPATARCVAATTAPM